MRFLIIFPYRCDHRDWPRDGLRHASGGREDEAGGGGVGGGGSGGGIKDQPEVDLWMMPLYC